jgi:putative transposase
MARIARAVAPGVPHLVTQRGNRRQPTFFGDDDYRLYRELMHEWCGRLRVEVWAYCLMPNHVHLILAPHSADGLRRAIGEAHRRYTWQINQREDWRGHLWQGRFASYPLDEPHLLAAARYVELNPVRAGLVRVAKSWPWSSAKAHLAGRDDELARVAPLLSLVSEWRSLLNRPWPSEDWETLRQHERTGRPLGSPEFVADLERVLGRPLGPQRRGRKPKSP